MQACLDLFLLVLIQQEKNTTKIRRPTSNYAPQGSHVYFTISFNAQCPTMSFIP